MAVATTLSIIKRSKEMSCCSCIYTYMCVCVYIHINIYKIVSSITFSKLCFTSHGFCTLTKASFFFTLPFKKGNYMHFHSCGSPKALLYCIFFTLKRLWRTKPDGMTQHTKPSCAHAHTYTHTKGLKICESTAYKTKLKEEKDHHEVGG